MSASKIDEIVTKRRDFLTALHGSPATKPELVDRLDTSRSTVDRAIQDLEAAELVHRPDNRYELTMVGKKAYERHQQYLDKLADIQQANEIISAIPVHVPFSLEMLADAEIQQAQRHDPHQPLELAAETISDATCLHQIAPAVFPMCIQSLRTRIEDGMELELVVPPSVIDVLLERYRDDLDYLDRSTSNVYELSDVPPYALWIAEKPDGEYAGLMSHSDTGVRGLIVTDNADALAWAHEQYERYRDEATLVDLLSERA